MPLTYSLPNGPASKVAGGSHCSGPVRTKVESGVGAAAAAGAGLAASAGVATAAVVAGVAGPWAPAAIAVASDAALRDCRMMRFSFKDIDTIPPEQEIGYETREALCC